VYGAFAATLGFNLSGITASGGFEVELNSTTGTPQVTDPLDSSKMLTLAAQTTVVAGSNDQLSVAGATISAGSISITSSASGLELEVTSLNLTVASGGTTYVDIQGSLDLFVSSAGVAADGSVTASFTLPSPMTLMGAVSIDLELNTGATPYTFPGSGTPPTTVPAGPFLQVAVDGATLMLPGGLSIMGNFVFAQNTEPSYARSARPSHRLPPHPEPSPRSRLVTSTATAFRTSSSA
jgi:hypothetical protein